MKHILLVLITAFFALACGRTHAQGSTFTYQGRLQSGGGLANGLYEMNFGLFDGETNGNVIGTPVTVAPVAVSNGLFTVALDFGTAAFSGPPRWLEITLNVFGSDMVPTTVRPRQPITATPFALQAANAANLMSSGNGPLDIKVNGQRVLRLEANGDTANVIGGASVNGVGAGVLGATIGGGGSSSPGFELTNRIDANYGTIGGGAANAIQALARDSVISGGVQNTIQADAGWSTIGGGESNTIEPYARYSTISGGGLNRAAGYGSVIAGGSLNAVRTNAEHASIGGGLRNLVTTDAMFSAIGGGEGHTSSREYGTIGGGVLNRTAGAYASVGGGRTNTSSGEYATVAGGFANAATGDATTIAGGLSNRSGHESSTVAGGAGNVADADYATVSGGSGNNGTGDMATVAGGLANTSGGQIATVSGGEHNTASGWWGVVPGGSDNIAGGRHSFAAGRAAEALHDGAFVWADDSETNFVAVHFSSTARNEFSVRATGGVRFVSAINTNGPNLTGVMLAPGSGTWSSLSDHNAKENFAAVNAREILEKISALPMTSWNYKSQDKSVRHLGPVAQDFHAAFGLGENDHTITTVDADGVALAAIQGLHQVMKQKDDEIKALQERVQKLEQLFTDLMRNGVR